MTEKDLLETYQEMTAKRTEKSISYLNQTVIKVLGDALQQIGCRYTEGPEYLIDVMGVISAFYLERLLGEDYEVNIRAIGVTGEAINFHHRVLVNVFHPKSGTGFTFDPCYQLTGFQGESLAVLENPMERAVDAEPVKIRSELQVIPKSHVFSGDWRYQLWQKTPFGDFSPIRIAGMVLGKLLTEEPETTMSQFHLEKFHDWKMYTQY